LLRPWSSIPIVECCESLESVPSSLLRISPHPYQSLNAPYGKNMNPWRLRIGLINRLLIAQNNLKILNPSFQLGLYDALRPLTVQLFMFNHEIDVMCEAKGFKRNDPNRTSELNNIVNQVSKFWAPPISDPMTPPPHSTGAAVDLTLYNLEGLEVDLGSKIDFIGSISSPNYFAQEGRKNDEARDFHQKRSILKKVMLKAGFVQHPNEWWHFSFGDQLWAWKTKKKNAIYGSWEVLSEINDKTSLSPNLLI